MPVPNPPRAESDLALMSLVAARDARAQRILVERLCQRVLRVARLLCGSHADGEDAAQLSLLEILNSAQSYQVDSSLERWAERITVRTALRQLRREHQRRGLLARWLVPGTLPWGSRCEEPEPNAKLGLDPLLARLSPPRREALLLHHSLDYSVEEIAELTGTPPGTVKDRLVAGRRQLRKLLDRDASREARRRLP